MLGIRSSGSLDRTIMFLTKLNSAEIFRDLNRYGQMGVDALARATPVDTGETARSWAYRILHRKGQWGIEWYNTNEENGVNIAILLQYGHGTGTGGYVAGYDYINPAIRPIFDKISDNVWKKVTNG